MVCIGHSAMEQEKNCEPITEVSFVPNKQFLVLVGLGFDERLKIRIRGKQAFYHRYSCLRGNALCIFTGAICSEFCFTE